MIWGNLKGWSSWVVRVLYGCLGEGLRRWWLRVFKPWVSHGSVGAHDVNCLGFDKPMTEVYLNLGWFDCFDSSGVNDVWVRRLEGSWF
jgi:hypothetical protein